MKNSVSRCLGVSFLVVAVAGCAAPARDSAWAPSRPIEFVVAAGPGGGSDLLARTVQSIIQKYELIDGSVIVTTVAFYRTVLARVRDTKEWKAWLRTGSQTDAFRSGTELTDYIAADERWLRGQFAEDGWLVQ